MMDLISSFMNKNLDDFVKSYASSILPDLPPLNPNNNNCNASESDNKSDTTQQNKDSNIIEHKEYSQPDSPHLLSADSFIDKSIVESITSETNKTLLNDINESQVSEHETPVKQINKINDNITDNRNNKMYGEYGKEKFDLSVDILPMVTTNNIEITNKKIEKVQIESIAQCNDDIATTNANDTLVFSELDDQWTQLPNVVNTDIKLDLKPNNIKSLSVSANDSFLTNIAKEIELLDEELSSMGLITGNNSQIITKTNSVFNDKIEKTIASSDIEHSEEEKMDVLKHNNENENDSNNEENMQTNIENTENEIINEENEQEIEVIKDKLSLLRKSLIFKKKTIPIQFEENQNEIEPLKCDNVILNDSMLGMYDSFITFADDREKDAFFDPLVSPIKKMENINEYNEAIYHENATKIQKQWKKFQLKTLLVNTFNRHLKQAKDNKLPLTVADLMASTTHEIVDHAEKLFSLVHDNNDNKLQENKSIGNYSYSQLHFYGSPALDWSATYSMIESIVLRNLLYFDNSEIVKQIMDTQRILNDIIEPNNTMYSSADITLMDQLTTQLIELKTKLYETCNSNNMNCNINPLQLFPPNVNIFKSNSTKPKQIESNNSTVSKSISPVQYIENNNSVSHMKHTSKPELNQIRNQLSLLRKSFSQRRRNVKKIRSSIQSSPQLSSSLCSSIMKVNSQIHSLCHTPSIAENQPIVKIDDGSNNNKIHNEKFTFDTNYMQSEHMDNNRPMTAPNLQRRYELPPKKSYLKRKKQSSRTIVAKKPDWSHVKPKTVSHLSNNVRSIRIANNRRSHYKPNVINWKRRVSSRVDCNWSPDKYRSVTAKKSKPKTKKQKHSNEFIDSYSNNYNNIRNDKVSDDKYLYYLKKGNKVGKISRDSAKAQLHDGQGDMILQPMENCKEEVESENDMEISVSDNDFDVNYNEECDEEFQEENQLKELQQTFAAIEKAMKQRRQQQQQHL